MTTELTVDLCVIGAGAGGLSVAAGAVLMGASTVLIERGAMGGDCLNYGCVPSKALLAAAKRVDAVRSAGRFGVVTDPPRVDFARVQARVRSVIDAIAPNDSQERFEAMGVHVIRADARFVGRDTVAAGDRIIKAKRFVVATGSRTALPEISGLDRVDYLTNETVFDLTEPPGHLIVLGGGPIGVELAQAHRKLGCAVTLFERGSTILPRDDPELVAMLRTRMRQEGISVVEGASVVGINRAGDQGVVLTFQDGQQVRGDRLLVATGRIPNLEGLNLEAACIRTNAAGIVTDRRLRTRNKRVYAVGDVVGGPQFTHVASHHASVVIKNALFRIPAKVDYRALPWVTYTMPELAQVGLTEPAARARHDRLTLLRWPFAENDRAQTDGMTDGLIKVVTTPGGRILGASILGDHAGELLLPWSLAIAKGLKVGDVASLIAPYPTLSEASKRAAGSWFVPKLFSERTRALVRFLLKLG